MRAAALVQCPYRQDLWYFLWHCREQQALRRVPCVLCQGPQEAEGLMDIVGGDEEVGEREIDD